MYSLLRALVGVLRVSDEASCVAPLFGATKSIGNKFPSK
jgi:hypothetical protein